MPTGYRSWKITARNNKNQAIKLVLKDQIPISTTDDIKIEDVSLDGGQWNEETGTVIWKLTLAPKAQQELVLKYAAKYPKDRSLFVE